MQRYAVCDLSELNLGLLEGRCSEVHIVKHGLLFLDKLIWFRPKMLQTFKTPVTLWRFQFFKFSEIVGSLWFYR